MSEKIKKVLVFEPRKCIGCRLCEQICSMTHFEVSNPAKSCIRIIRQHQNQVDIAIHCHQCVNAPCIEACNYEALSKDKQTNAIKVNEENCIGCRLCIEECPYAVPSINPDSNTILICDLCDGDPKCVEICPENAIQFVELHKAANIYKSIFSEDYAHNLIKRGNNNE